MHTECFASSCNRALIKCAIMPLVYGKTGHGFVLDLEKFFAKGRLYSSRATLLAYANQVMELLKGDPDFAKPLMFMQGLKAIAGLLVESDRVVRDFLRK